MSRLFILGHPGLYGGAGTELHHQIQLWRKMGMPVTIIPSMKGFENEPLKPEMEALGVEYAEKERDYSAVTQHDVVINFCGKEFLEDLDRILEKTQRTCFVNCMTWLFPKEKEAHAKGKIAYSLYQRPQVRDYHKKELEKLGSSALFLHFRPYFNSEMFPYHGERANERFTLGRISRQDADKFSKSTWHIWEYAVAPVLKRGICLGFDLRSLSKTGNPPSWVERHLDHGTISVQDFYKECDVIVQSSDTTENWPRIGFEAMFSGCPLVVDNRGGWQFMIEHKISGFLCNTQQEFIYWTSRLAFEEDLRSEIRLNAARRAEFLAGERASADSWRKIFEIMFN